MQGTSQRQSSPPGSPGPQRDDGSASLVLEAVRHSAIAMDHENNKQWNEAIRSYRTAIGILNVADGWFS